MIFMKYPKTLNVKVENIFGDQDVQITLYSGLTIFVGTNASGKTQTLKKIRDIMCFDRFRWFYR